MKREKTMSKYFRGILALVVALAVGNVCESAFAGEYTDKSYHASDGVHTYKHKRKSYTSPFDYGPVQQEEPAAPRPKAAPAPAPAPMGRCNCFTFDATKSYDVDGQKLSVMWDFGDGQTSDAAVVKHCYEKAGTYKVMLTVKDTSGMVCDNGIATTTVDANYPPVAQAGDDKKACVGEAITFDASDSTASGPATYRWNFGDGETGEGMRVSHSYSKAGKYRVVLTVDDGKGTVCSVASDETWAHVADAVSVSVSGPESACLGETVSFNAQGSGGSVKYHWDFGDGTTAEGGSRASHKYEKSGSYLVVVTADNGQGFDCSRATSSTRIKVNGAPVADAGDNLACCTGEQTVFDGSRSSDPDGDTLSYHWDFGDGETGEGARVNHAYAKSGTYRVVLTVKDNSDSDCGMSSDSFTATVNTQPTAVIEVR